MDRQNKICSCARKSGWRKNNAGTDKEEEKKLAGPLTKKELSAEGCSRRNGKGKKVRGTRYQMIDNFIINGLYEDTKRKTEKRVKWRRLSLQWKTYPWAEHCDTVIDWLIDWYAARLYVCVFEKVVTALVNEELSSDCPSQCIFKTCNRSQNPPFSGYIYPEHNRDNK